MPRYCPSQQVNRLPKRSVALSMENTILEGDLVVYRFSAEQPWKLAAVTHRYNDIIDVAPVVSRPDEDGTEKLSLFVDWSEIQEKSRSFTISSAFILPLDADFESRVIEDRIINPHGEESEDCWCLHPAQLEQWSIELNKNGGVLN